MDFRDVTGAGLHACTGRWFILCDIRMIVIFFLLSSCALSVVIWTTDKTTCVVSGNCIQYVINKTPKNKWYFCPSVLLTTLTLFQLVQDQFVRWYECDGFDDDLFSVLRKTYCSLQSNNYIHTLATLLANSCALWYDDLAYHNDCVFLILVGYWLTCG